MGFIFGTIILVVAVALLGGAKYVVSRWEDSSWVRRFAATEMVALTITTTIAFGVAFLGAGLSAEQSGLGYVELAASFGCVVLALVGVARIFRPYPARLPVTDPARAPAVPSGQATI